MCLQNKCRKYGVKLYILGCRLLSITLPSSQTCIPGSISVLLVYLNVRIGLLNGNEYKIKQKCERATKLLYILFPYLDELSLLAQLRCGGACHESYFFLTPHHSHSAPNTPFRLSKQVSSFNSTSIYISTFETVKTSLIIQPPIVVCPVSSL